MPITIHAPGVGNPIGAGMLIDFQTDTPPPSGGPWFWEVTIGAPGEPWITQTFSRAFTARIVENLLTNFRSSSLAQNAAVIAPSTGANIQVQADITDGLTVYETHSQSAVWSETRGLALQQFLQPSTTVQGGFTDQDRVALQAVESATIVNYAQPVAVPSTTDLPLGGFAWNGALGLLNRANSVLISGRGSVDRPAHGSSMAAYGVRVFFTVVPPGYGFTPGAIDVFERRMVQLAVIRIQSDSSEWASNVWDIRQSGGVYIWDYPLAQRLEYQVAPGVTAELQWQVLPLQA